jgi:CheY-like chemotaxis protein
LLKTGALRGIIIYLDLAVDSSATITRESMAQTGPIIIIDDDQDDRELIKEMLEDIGVKNKMAQFGGCMEALEYLLGDVSDPFLILCDMNLPLMDGIEFKKKIDKNKMLRNKSIPFIFYSTAANQKVVNMAYRELNIQGYFLKENTYTEIRRRIKIIVDYWADAEHPDLSD